MGKAMEAIIGVAIIATVGYGGCKTYNHFFGSHEKKPKAQLAEEVKKPEIKQILLYGADPSSLVLYDEFDASTTDVVVNEGTFCYDKADSHMTIYSAMKCPHATCITGNYVIRSKRE